VLNHRYLARRVGMGQVVAELRFACQRCRARRYRLRFVADELGESAPLRLQHFDGVYEKFRE
jgi:hypothetical protein